MQKKNTIPTPGPGYLRIWRLSVLLVLLSTIGAPAYASGQELLHKRVTISFKKNSLPGAINRLGELARINITYNSELLPKQAVVTGSYVNKTIAEVLEALLAPYGVTHVVVEDQIILRKMRPSSDSSPPAEPSKAPALPEKRITGTVSDDTGAPLPGVNIIAKGSTAGTVTDAGGTFSLVLPDGVTTLTFSFVGYLSQDVDVTNETTLSVMLAADQKALQEVVVVGYGTRKKANLTGAVDQISAEALQNRPLTNVSRGLQGLIPNLNVTNRGGNPNAGAALNLRGTTSVNGGGPLVLVDNVQMDLDLLNPDDIESISVLKDAASAAIYGARGSFGVILVTLKKGARDRKPVISYTGGMEFNRPTYLPDMLNSMEYMEATNLARQRRYGSVVYSAQQLEWARAHFNDPLNTPSYHMQPNGSIFWHANVDNFAEMLQPWAPAANHSLNVNGGSRNISYFASVGARKQEGMFRDATDVLKRYNVLLNLNAQLNDRLKLGFKTSFTRRNYDEPHRYTGKGSSWWEQMTRGVPQILFPIRTPADAPIPDAPTEHFYNFLNSGSRLVTGTEVGLYSANAEYEIIPGLKLKGDFSYQSTNQLSKDTQKEFGFIRDKWEYQYNQTTPSYVRRTSSKTDYFAGNAYLTFDKELKGQHYLSLLAGFNQEWSTLSGFEVTGNNLISNQVPVLSLRTGEIITRDNESDWAIRGLFTRLSYSFKEKYLFEMNGRYDGTSRFPRARRFNFFPSFSAGWRLSEEPMMTWARPALNELKLRVSYGRLGNQNLATAYPFVTRFSVVNPVLYLFESGLPLGLNPPGLVSPNLTWEKASTLDFGADISLWNKLHVTFDWYERTTSDMLVAGEKLPAVLGVTPPSRNGAALKTRGWELSVKYGATTSGGFSYDAGLVLSDYQATITRFANNPQKIWSTYYEGQKLGEIWGYETVGFFRSQQEIADAPSHTQIAGVARQPGDIRYADLNGDGVINWGTNTVGNPGDKKIIGNSTPRYQFGLTGNFTWKGFDGRLFFQGIGKRNVFPKGNFFWGQLNSAGAVGNKDVYYNSWSEENPDAYYPIYKQDTPYNIQEQTRYLQSAAYIRLKNVTLGYALPAAVSKKAGLQKVRVYFSGENLWEYTPLKGRFDPEVISGEEGQDGQLGQFYPLQRTLSFGLQLTL